MSDLQRYLPLMPSSDKILKDNVLFLIQKWLNFYNFSNAQVTYFSGKPQIKMNIFQKLKHGVLIHTRQKKLLMVPL